MRIGLSRAGLRTKRLERPLISHFIVAKDVGVAIIGPYAKVNRLWTVPLIFNGFDKENRIAEPEFDRALVGFVTGVAFNLDLHNVYSDYHGHFTVDFSTGVLKVSRFAMYPLNPCFLLNDPLTSGTPGRLDQHIVRYGQVVSGQTIQDRLKQNKRTFGITSFTRDDLLFRLAERGGIDQDDVRLLPRQVEEIAEET